MLFNPTHVVPCTWAEIKNETPPAGTMRYVTDIGGGTVWVYNGTRWKLLSGTASIAALGNAVAAIANAETILFQSLLPINSWQINDLIRLWIALTKSGATDTGTVRVRIGTAGTTADTLVITAAVLAAANLSGGFIFDMKLTSATAVQKTGQGNSANGTYSIASNQAAPAAVTITSAATNALYVTVSALSSSTNDTLTAQNGQLQLVTP